MAYIFLVLSFVFFLIWLASFVMFHVTAGAIHVVLALAILFIIVHFVRRVSGHTPTS